MAIDVVIDKVKEGTKATKKLNSMNHTIVTYLWLPWQLCNLFFTIAVKIQMYNIVSIIEFWSVDIVKRPQLAGMQLWLFTCAYYYSFTDVCNVYRKIKVWRVVWRKVTFLSDSKIQRNDKSNLLTSCDRISLWWGMKWRDDTIRRRRMKTLKTTEPKQNGETTK